MTKHSSEATEKMLAELAEHALGLAARHGAQQAAASVSHVREVEVAWRDGQLERLHEAQSRGLAIEFYVDGRFASVSTSDLRREALEPLVRDGVAMTRALEPDPFRKLADPERYPDPKRALDDSDLQLSDPHYGDLTALQRREQAQALEVAARSVPGADKILSVSTSVSDSQSTVFRCDSQGFRGFRHSTSFWRSAEVSVQDPDGRRPEESDYHGARFLADVFAPELVGKSAAERALQRVGAVKLPSGQRTLLVDARAAGRLVSALLGPMSASSLQQKRSFYSGDVGQLIGSPLLDIRDDPFVVRGFASRYFDGEGMASAPRPLYQAGKVANFFVDTYYGRKLGWPATCGHASNLAWILGNADLEGLMRGVDDGLLVTGFLGGNSNATTGDFSLGIQGFAIRQGKLAEPFGEMNLAGSHLTFWQQLTALGNDPNLLSPLRTPTLVFADAAVAGA
jgi:PmbA protein